MSNPIYKLWGRLKRARFWLVVEASKHTPEFEEAHNHPTKENLDKYYALLKK